MPVSLANLEECAETICAWAKRGESRYVCVANVHMAVECSRNEQFASILETSDLTTSDGMPLVWLLRLQGHRGKRRVCGRDLTLETLGRAENERIAVGFLGSDPATLDLLERAVMGRFPQLDIAYRESPPFRPATAKEELSRARSISASGARILFVGLGCPKQERWMHDNCGKVGAVMLGIGAAFDFLAGTKPVSPKLMQRLGLEWLHRLASEPRRLWRRYLLTNARFLQLVALQFLRRGA